MLFLYRPRQTWMPFGPPRNLMSQDQYRWDTQDKFAATRRVPPAAPSDDTVARLKDVAELHRSGALDDDEFAAAKAKILGSGNAGE